MNKKMKHLAIFALAHSFVIFFCLITIFLGYAAPFINGFAIDSQENLYVGEGKTIYIYQAGTQVGEICLKSATYAFFIDNNGKLIVAYPSVVDRMLTSGEVVETREDPVAETYQRIRNSGNVVVTSNGDKYQKVGEFGWTRIEKNGTEIIYKIPTLSFLVKMLLYVCAVSLFTNGVWVIRRIREMR